MKINPQTMSALILTMSSIGVCYAENAPLPPPPPQHEGMGMRHGMGGVGMGGMHGMGMGGMHGMMANMSDAERDKHMRKMQEHMLKMHDLSNKILAEKDPAKQETLKTQQIDLMKAHHAEMMANMSQHHPKTHDAAKPSAAGSH